MSNATDTFASCLRELGVVGQVVEFDTDLPTAAAAAEKLGCELGAIANSLVFTADDEPLLIIASGAHRVDTKHVARLLGVRKIRRATPEFVLAVTGQPVGGVGPVDHPQRIRTVVDQQLADHPVVWAGAGRKHAMFPTSFDELVRITDGLVADVEKP
ncbi:YbaK/EbsC family protein [Saccharopolyspora sp. K220]|uniref:YbaK/EbsC family protein n=1 Tax=Saccharopolyspora soli TaxID=2926618 RepID=UPI001F59DCAC|nr:YbaK/EbsC family protein [Saccharopolyspora soli]MCI2423479.1 YbaK/EbsC family protein [Saccharopolyspora soli]